MGNTEESMTKKATVDEIRNRFDNDVERFSNLETGQSATIDAPLVLDLIAASASAVTPHAVSLLDIGCGAGNFSLKLLDSLPSMAVTLIDLSRPMLERAEQRIGARARSVTVMQTDIRDAIFEPASFDIVVAAAVLHHLRTDEEWRLVFEQIFRSLRPGGSFWVADLVEHSIPEVQAVMWRRYGEYLESFKGEAYRRHVIDYVTYEDTPKPLMFQLDLMREVGFRRTDVLHKNSCFAAFGGVK